MKYIIFDSGSIINIVEKGLTEYLKKLETIFQGEFLITEAIKYETIDHPLKIKKFEWGAIRIKSLLEDKVINLAEDDFIEKDELKKKTKEVLDKTNNCFYAEGKPIHLIDKGEAECLALSLLFSEKKIENVVSIDERTARMLCEDSEKLRMLMQKKLKKEIKLKEENIREFKKIKIIRSTELMYVAYKKNLFDHDKRKIEAVLYALKFGGCSISEKEVQMMKNL